jgi:hypothetical protein
MNLKKLQKKCNQLHRQIRQKLQSETEDDEDNAERDFGLGNAESARYARRILIIYKHSIHSFLEGIQPSPGLHLSFEFVSV